VTSVLEISADRLSTTRSSVIEGVLFGEFLESSEDGGEKRSVWRVMADGEPLVAEEPDDRSIDDQAVLGDFLTGLDVFTGDAHGNAALVDPVPKVGLVVGLVGVQFVGCAAAGSVPKLDRRDPYDQEIEGAKSLVLAADTTTARGGPATSDRTWISEIRTCCGRAGSGRS
jgi:hypothetical protein